MESVHEEWRSVPGFTAYQVSNLGRVKSLARLAPHYRGGTKRVPERILKPINHKGYLIVKLGKPDLAFGVHRVVAWAFIGPQENGNVVNHIDGDKQNNKPANLEYVTNSENVDHAYRTGLLSNQGTTNGKAKLTEEMVARILAFPTDLTAQQVADAVGCKVHNVRQVRSGRAWKHVPRQSASTK